MNEIDRGIDAIYKRKSDMNRQMNKIERRMNEINR